MDPSEPDGITSAPETSTPSDPSVAPPGAVTKSRLQNLEQNLLVLERTYGATHPQVSADLADSFSSVIFVVEYTAESFFCGLASSARDAVYVSWYPHVKYPYISLTQVELTLLSVRSSRAYSAVGPTYVELTVLSVRLK